MKTCSDDSVVFRHVGLSYGDRTLSFGIDCIGKIVYSYNKNVITKMISLIIGMIGK